MKETFLNLSEFADSLNISRPTAKQYLTEDKIKFFQRGRRYFIPPVSYIMAEKVKKVKDNSLEPMILSITNQKGGVGKTTASINLATSYAFFGLKVLLVDNDVQGNASKINKEDTNPNNDFVNQNLINLLLRLDDLEKDEVRDAILSTIVPVKNKNIEFKGKIDLLPNNFMSGDMIELFITRTGSENLLDRLLKHIKGKYDVIIIDNAPALNQLWRMSVIASNSILVTLRPDQYSVDGIIGILKAIKKTNNAYFDRHQKNIRVLGAVLSIFDKNTNSDKAGLQILSKILEDKEILIFTPFISRTTLANDSQFFGGSVFYDNPISKISAEYIELAYNIYDKFYSEDNNE